MSDNEEFLARWSRRKREAKHAGEAEPQLAEPMEAQPPVPSDGSVAEPANPEIDVSSLPPVDSIDAATDITAFLRKGIPQELLRAALRRAWAADPAIRDFVGLAENAWDFNDPDAMPGFGPLDPSQVEVGAFASRTVEGIRQVVAKVSDAPAAGEVGQAADRESNLGKDSVPLQAPDPSRAAEARPVFAAPQPLEKFEREETPARRRTHGGALPH